MIDSVLVKRNAIWRTALTVRTLLSAAIVALAVILPQFVHLVAGPGGGVRFLPMYLPVLLGGCLLGPLWGLGVGVLSPLVSFLVTSAWGAPMPAAERLPFMMAELAVFACVTGLFSKKIAGNGLWAFPAVLSAAVAGRGLFLLSAALFSSFSSLSPAVVWGQIVAGLPALAVQAVAVPLVVMWLQARLLGETHDGR